MPVKLFCPFLTLKEKQQNNKKIKKTIDRKRYQCLNKLVIKLI